MSTHSADHRSRALVLGGGGPVGRAWEIGLVGGFADEGIDFGITDLIIGTSAGAVVGAQLLLKHGFGGPPEVTTLPPVDRGSMADLAAAMMRAAQSPKPEPVRAQIGRLALNAQTISEEASTARPMFAPFIGRAWPNQLRVTTVNARTGQLQIWDASSGARWSERWRPALLLRVFGPQSR
jgi:NTE family protein